MRCVNLFGGTQSQRKRRVVPGPAGRSPFVCQYRLSDRASGNATLIYVKFTQLTAPVMSNNWVITKPQSYIEMTGYLLKKQLGVNSTIESDLMNLLMRRFQQLENE